MLKLISHLENKI